MIVLMTEGLVHQLHERRLFLRDVPDDFEPGQWHHYRLAAPSPRLPRPRDTARRRPGCYARRRAGS